ncbi:MAG: type II toxin-antitoxin system VapB family antitoxin [Synechococcaceae bacterium WB9_2_112]|nr:type II toxin-antitoxin system VapB family antitoxin [Synechococcaceae bacterium WB9_2_112]
MLWSYGMALTGAKQPMASLRRALRALMEQEPARRLALLGRTESEPVSPPRRGG